MVSARAEAWQSRNHKLQKFCSAGDKELLWKNIQETWKSLPQSVIEAGYTNMALVLNLTREHKGENAFEVPHNAPGRGTRLWF